MALGLEFRGDEGTEHELMHRQAYSAVARLRPLAVQRVYEIGSREVNGGIRPLFDDAVEYHGIDVAPGPGVDAVADGASYEPPFQPDCVVCCEVLEHAFEPQAIVETAARVLAPGGAFIVTCAGPGRLPHSAVDGGPLRAGESYQNISGLQMRHWLRAAGFEAIYVELGRGVRAGRVDPDATDGDLYALATKPLEAARHG